MNTPAHLIIGAAAFAKPGHRAVTVAALAGGFAPDLSLYVMVSVSIWGLGISPGVVFGELYYSPAWQQVFAVDNSFVLWGVALALAWRARSPVWVAFTGAALLHLLLDFPLHSHDARMHFWPLSTWVFESPISYWNSAESGALVGWLEWSLCLVLSVLLWRRFTSWRMRFTFGALFAAETVSSGIWRLFF